jgi:hypothetical protein
MTEDEKIDFFDKKKESVNHPSHYNNNPSGVECIDVVEHMTFNIGNAIKYLWRAGLKGDLVEDLKKARWYIDREIQRVEKMDDKKEKVAK